MKYDKKLTVLGKQRETSIKRAVADPKGRIPKKEWAKHVGTNFRAYKDAETHMPRGMSYVVLIKAAKEVQKVRKLSKMYVLERAKNVLRRAGNKKCTDEEAHVLIAQQNKQIKKLNRSLAQKRAKMREYNNQEKETEKDFLLKQVLYKHAAKVSGEKISGAPQKPSASEKKKKRRQYYHFLNRVLKQTRNGGN